MGIDWLFFNSQRKRFTNNANRIIQKVLKQIPEFCNKNITSYTFRQAIIRSSNYMRRNVFISKTVSEDIGAASRGYTSTTANFIYNPEYTKMMARVAYFKNREVEESYIEGSDYKKITMTVISDDEESLCPFKEKIKVNVEKKETKSAVKTSVCFENQLISKVSVHIRDVAL